MKAAAREHTSAAIASLVGIMQDPAEAAIARIRAAEILLDRGYGKQHQSSDDELTTQEAGPRVVIVRAPDCPHVIDADGRSRSVILHNGRESAFIDTRQDLRGD